jgi:hypothetical protein
MQSLRQLATYSYNKATLFWALFQLFEPNRFWNALLQHLSLRSASTKNLGRLIKSPLERCNKTDQTYIYSYCFHGGMFDGMSSHWTVNITYHPEHA